MKGGRGNREGSKTLEVAAERQRTRGNCGMNARLPWRMHARWRLVLGSHHWFDSDVIPARDLRSLSWEGERTDPRIQLIKNAPFVRGFPCRRAEVVMPAKRSGHMNYIIGVFYKVRFGTYLLRYLQATALAPEFCDRQDVLHVP